MKEKVENIREKYDFIDVLKFVLSIFVIGIHANICADESNNAQWYVLHMFFRIAVPFFFIASGFFYGKKYKKNPQSLKEITKNQIKRLMVPFCFWLLVSLPYAIFTTNETSIIKMVLQLIRKAIFYPWGALWFVLALIVAIIIEYFFLKKGKLKIALTISFFLYFFALLGNSYYFIIEGTKIQNIIDVYMKVCISTRNGIFMGFPIFTLGVYIAQKENIIENIKKYKAYILIFIFLLIQFFEVTFIRDKHYINDHSLFFTTIPIACLLLCICIKYKKIHIKKINAKLLRNLSTGIYFIHAPVVRYTFLVNPDINSWIVFIGTTIITISIGLIFSKIDNKFINRLIK